LTIVFQTDTASWSTQTSVNLDGQTTATVAGNDISVVTLSTIVAPWLYAEAPITNPNSHTHFWAQRVGHDPANEQNADHIVPLAGQHRYTIMTVLPGDIWWGNINLSTPDGWWSLDNDPLCFG
jgi:hypothetical protein